MTVIPFLTVYLSVEKCRRESLLRDVMVKILMCQRDRALGYLRRTLTKSYINYGHLLKRQSFLKVPCLLT